MNDLACLFHEIVVFGSPFDVCGRHFREIGAFRLQFDFSGCDFHIGSIRPRFYIFGTHLYEAGTLFNNILAFLEVILMSLVYFQNEESIMDPNKKGHVTFELLCRISDHLIACNSQECLI